MRALHGPGRYNSEEDDTAREGNGCVRFEVGSRERTLESDAGTNQHLGLLDLGTKDSQMVTVGRLCVGTTSKVSLKLRVRKWSAISLAC